MGFVCPNDNFPPLVEGAVDGNGGDILNPLPADPEFLTPEFISKPPNAAVKSLNAPSVPDSPKRPFVLALPATTAVVTAGVGDTL